MLRYATQTTSSPLFFYGIVMQTKHATAREHFPPRRVSSREAKFVSLALLSLLSSGKMSRTVVTNLSYQSPDTSLYRGSAVVSVFPVSSERTVWFRLYAPYQLNQFASV